MQCRDLRLERSVLGLVRRAVLKLRLEGGNLLPLDRELGVQGHHQGLDGVGGALPELGRDTRHGNFHR